MHSSSITMRMHSAQWHGSKQRALLLAANERALPTSLIIHHSSNLRRIAIHIYIHVESIASS